MSKIRSRTAVAASGMLRFAIGLAVLAALLYAGGELVQRLGIPIPPAIAGMILLLALLGCVGRLTATVQVASTPLLKHMMLFFIPAVAGVMEQFHVLQAGWLPFVAACIAGAVMTLAATALTLEWLLARQQNHR